MTVFAFRNSDPMTTEFPTEQVQFYPDAKVIHVYGSSEDDIDYRGMVRVNYMGYIGYTTTEPDTDQDAVVSQYQGQFEVDAYMGLWGAFKPTTEGAQSTTDRISHPMNQQYGFISPPRIGDRVLVAHFGGDKWVVLAIFPAQGGNEQPPHDDVDLSIIHRSGSSVRMNDRYPSSQTGLPVGDFDGISGHLSLVGNRVMFLSGNMFLPHGLLSDFEARNVNIDLNDDDVDGHSYASVFDNASEPNATSNPYYEPWDGSLGAKKFLQPPVVDEGYVLVHDGGGMIRIQKGTENHSNMRLGARGVTIFVGQKYWNAGLKDETSHDSPAPVSTIEDDVFKIVHHSGAYIKIDANGKINIVTADGQDYEIAGTGAGSVLLGSGATNNVIAENVDTDTTTLIDSIFQLPCRDATTQLPAHKHGLTAGQSEVKVP